ncbi:MAG: prepilin peptidase [Lachnospiraceae bacterium]|nr:prepilin peptidase [Lachnospiraceae bacterium]
MLLIYIAHGDFRERKIRNTSILLLWIIQLLMYLQSADTSGAFAYVGRCIGWMLILFVLYRLGALGAGDVKLLAVIAAGLVQDELMLFWLGTSSCALVMAIWVWVKRKSIKATLPLAIAICFGYGTVLLLGRGGLM